MPDVDIVVGELKVKVEGVVNLEDLYRLIKEWLEFHGYNFFEKEYIDTIKDSGKDIKIILLGDKKADDYAKFEIVVKIKVEDAKEVEFKKGTGFKGSISVGFESDVLRDYENEWEKTFLLRFIRAVYDKFIIKDKLEKYRSELEDETQDIYRKVKEFLGANKIRV